MRIMILTHNYPRYPDDGYAAAGLFVPDFARALQSLGHEAMILTPNVVGEKVPDPTLPVRWFEWRGNNKKNKKLGHLNPRRPADALALLSLFYRGSQAAIQLARENEIDRCLALWAVPSGIFAHAAYLKADCPYDVWALGSDIWIHGRRSPLRPAVRRVLLRADGLFADGPELCDEVERLAGRACQFLPTARRLPVKTTPAASLDPQRFHFLFIGRWELAKGPDLLIDAFSRLAAVEGRPGQRAHLHIFGGGALEGVMRSKIEAYNLQRNVTLHGYANPAMVVAYMKACDALVIPSRIESIPVIFSDAMQVGIPVVATNVGDLGQVVRQYEVGVVVGPEDPEGLAGGMGQVMEGRLSIPSEAFQVAASAFGMKGIAETYLNNVEQRTDELRAVCP